MAKHAVMLSSAIIHFGVSRLARLFAALAACRKLFAGLRLPPLSSRLPSLLYRLPPPASHLPQSSQASRLAQSLRRRPLIFMLCIGVTACGFQLRGVAEFPFETLFVDAPPASPFATQLRRVIGAGNRTRITANPAEADATLQLVYELREREILSLSPEGRAREFQLRYRVAYQVLDSKKQIIAPRAEIVLRRDYAFRDEEHLAREAEEVLLYRDMQNDAVHQLVRRLQAIKIAARS